MLRHKDILLLWFNLSPRCLEECIEMNLFIEQKVPAINLLSETHVTGVDAVNAYLKIKTVSMDMMTIN